jgi:tetratricopeptide (TPR) repeat protein
VLYDLAEVYRKQGRYEEAEPLYKRAIAIAEKARGPDDPIVGGRVGSLAALYNAQGHHPRGRAAYGARARHPQKVAGLGTLKSFSRRADLAAT